MKKILRAILILTIALSLVCSAAYAAKTSVAAVKPTLKLSITQKTITAGDYSSISLNASHPGFAYVQMLNPIGAPMLTLMDGDEIHTKQNDISFSTLDALGRPFAPGDYTITAYYVDQYGNRTSESTGSISIKENPDYIEMIEDEGVALIYASSAEDIAYAETAAAERDFALLAEASMNAATPAASFESGSVPDAAPDEVPSDAQAEEPHAAGAQTASAAVPVSNFAQLDINGISYLSGSTVMGDQGLEIGVGVSDYAQQADAGFWGLNSASSDEDIWAAIIRPMTSVDVGEDQSAYIYDSTSENRNKIGSVSGLSQGLNVIEKLGEWSLVEVYRNEDGALVRGYVRSKQLRTVNPNATYGIVIDKYTQTLIVFKDGQRIGSCSVSTGLPTKDYLKRETPAGEYITVTRRGTYEQPGLGFTKCTIRFSGNYYLSDVPTKTKNGTNYSEFSAKLGTKATRGGVVIAHEASIDGGINAEWIWKLTEKNKKIKVLILDDKARGLVPTVN